MDDPTSEGLKKDESLNSEAEMKLMLEDPVDKGSNQMTANGAVNGVAKGVTGSKPSFEISQVCTLNNNEVTTIEDDEKMETNQSKATDDNKGNKNGNKISEVENKTESNDCDSLDGGKKRSMATDVSNTDAKRGKFVDDDEIQIDDSEGEKVPADKGDDNGEEKKDIKSDNGDDIIIEKVERQHPAAVQGLCLPAEILQGFIRGCVRNFLKNRKQESLDKLSQQIKNQQSVSTYWLETAKHLEKSYDELNNIKKEIVKNNKVKKSLTCRSIAVQVTQEVASNDVKFTPHSSQQDPIVQSMDKNKNTSMSSLPPSVLLNPPTGVNPAPQKIAGTPPNATPPQRRPQSLPTQPGASRSQFSHTSPRQGQPPLSVPHQNGRLPTSAGPGSNKPSNNCIDLTDDDDLRAGPSQKQSRPMNGLSSHNTPVGRPSHPRFPTASHNSANNAPRSRAPQQRFPSTSQFPTPTLTSQLHAGAMNSTPPGNRPTLAVMPHNTPSSVNQTATKSSTLSLPPSVHINMNQHPAPAPPAPVVAHVPSFAKPSPPKPSLKISRVPQGIVLSWNMPSLDGFETIASYQLFAYQETKSVAPSTSLWKKVGDVKALPLPMACTLTQFQDGNKYYFTVRAVDQYGRCGSYSEASDIFLRPK